MTRTALIGSTMVVALVIAAAAQAQAPLPVVSVRPFTGDASHKINADLAGQLSDLMASDLVESGRYRVLDRAWLASGSQNGGVPPPDSMLDLAADAGVDLLVIGTVSKVTRIEQRLTPASGLPAVVAIFRGRSFAVAAPRVRTVRESALSVRVELVDVPTGRTVLSISSEHSAGGKKPAAIVPVLLVPGAPAILGAAALATSKSSAVDAGLRASITELANRLSHSAINSVSIAR